MWELIFLVVLDGVEQIITNYDNVILSPSNPSNSDVSYYYGGRKFTNAKMIESQNNRNWVQTHLRAVDIITILRVIALLILGFLAYIMIRNLIIRHLKLIEEQQLLANKN